jgi:putative membrane protein
MRLILRLVILAAALFLISNFVSGFEIDSWKTAAIVAVVLAIVNVTIKPLLMLIALPITILTLGLFAFVINAVLLIVISRFIEGFTIDGFVPALLGSLILSVINWIGERMFND